MTAPDAGDAVTPDRIRPPAAVPGQGAYPVLWSNRPFPQASLFDLEAG